jgi:hypothetical protein
MSVSITNVGNLVKIDTGDGIAQYFENESIPNIIQINPNTLLVTALNGNLTLFQKPLAQVSINGVVPANLSAFETAISDLIYGFIFTKMESLVSIGFYSTAITSRVRRITALGNNPDVDQATVPETIWPGGGLYPWKTAAGALEVVSSSVQDSLTGTGMGTISLTLLDANYNESVVSVVLNGTTPVAISGTWLRVNAGLTTVKGSGAVAVGAVNAGDISIRDSGAGTTRAIIPATKGVLRQAVFTVPAGYTLQIISQYLAFNRGTGGGATRYLTITGYIQNSSGVTRRPLDLSCDGEAYRHDGIPGITLPEKTDFAMEVIAISADNSDITGAFLGILMKNDLVATISY